MGPSKPYPGFLDAEFQARYGSNWVWLPGQANPEATFRGYAPSEIPIAMNLEGDLANGLMAGWKADHSAWWNSDIVQRDTQYNGKNGVPFPRLDLDKGDAWDGVDLEYRSSDHMAGWLLAKDTDKKLEPSVTIHRNFPDHFFRTWLSETALFNGEEATQLHDLARRLRASGWVIMVAAGVPFPPNAPTEKIAGSAGIEGVGIGTVGAGDNPIGSANLNNFASDPPFFYLQDNPTSGFLIPKTWLHPAPFTLETWVVDASISDVTLDLSAYTGTGFLGKTYYTAWRVISAAYHTKVIYKGSILKDGTLQDLPSSILFSAPGDPTKSHDIRWGLQVGFEHVPQSETVVNYIKGGGSAPDATYDIPREEGQSQRTPAIFDVIFYAVHDEVRGSAPFYRSWRGWPPIPWDYREGTPYGKPLPQTWVSGFPSAGGIGPIVYSGRADYDTNVFPGFDGYNAHRPHPYYGIFDSPMSL